MKLSLFNAFFGLVFAGLLVFGGPPTQMMIYIAGALITMNQIEIIILEYTKKLLKENKALDKVLENP